MILCSGCAHTPSTRRGARNEVTLGTPGMTLPKAPHVYDAVVYWHAPPATSSNLKHCTAKVRVRTYATDPLVARAWRTRRP